MSVADAERDATTRERITSVAMDLFLRDGYKATSVKAIAAEVGVTTPALYWHFPSKQEIFYAAMEQALVRFIDEVRGQVDAEDPLPRIAQIVRAHVGFQLERHELADAYQATYGFRRLVESLPAAQRDRIVAIQRSYTTFVRDTLERGRDAGIFHFEDLGVTTFALINFCEFPNSWYDPKGRLTLAQLADLHVDLALGMLRVAAS